MKRSVLFVLAGLAATPVFAADDLCTINLQKLSDYKATASTLGQPLLGQIHDARVEAQKAQAEGDIQKCISLTNKALQDVVNSQKGQ
ncbi:hypothetical protein [Pseudomonas sp. NKUCC02_KPG]|uniref:hypothetical protein n=1 Tax=Pseudomonas sp. NKUCC02_KPG TaxID=2842124 RepID=UPI00105615E2|nr:hypothetical protein [Pseudomonas sp. NKUCC02_KPG]MBW3503403.1 hypothetical protein [Pseudomonas sp. NKUCC02_KPG]